MSNLRIYPKWNPTINQLENGEPITAGDDGLINIAPRQLAENVFFVNNELDAEKIRINDLNTKLNTVRILALAGL